MASEITPGQKAVLIVSVDDVSATQAHIPGWGYESRTKVFPLDDLREVLQRAVAAFKTAGPFVNAVVVMAEDAGPSLGCLADMAIAKDALNTLLSRLGEAG